MAACGFDMQFIFVWAEWEGSAHNTRIFHEAIGNINIRFPRPPEGIHLQKNKGVVQLFLFFFIWNKKYEWNNNYFYAGKYYLVDSRYPNEYSYLGPYRGERYYLSEFHRRGQPWSREELFNRVHSSLRCVIERIYGVWKKRWRILQNMREFPYKSQVKIVVASMAD